MTQQPSAPSGEARTWRLELVRPINVAIRADRGMTDLFRTRSQGGRPAEVHQRGDTVTIEYPRDVVFFARRRRPSMVILNGSVPWRIEVRGSAAKVTADLGAIALLGYEVLGGASEVFLILPPPSGEVAIHIAGGASDVGIHRPTGVPVRVRVTGGASRLSLDDQRFHSVGGETFWQGPDFEDRADRYDITILKGATALTVGTLDIPGAPTPRLGRAVATVLFTDIVGSTERARKVGDRRWGEILDRHDASARIFVEQERGSLVKTTGDGILAVFDEPGGAIRCARAMREHLRGIDVAIRAGLHTGEVEHRGDDVGGIAVHIGSRIMDAASPGEILVSRTVRDLVVGSDVELQDQGTHALKGVGDDWQLFRVA